MFSAMISSYTFLIHSLATLSCTSIRTPDNTRLHTKSLCQHLKVHTLRNSLVPIISSFSLIFSLLGNLLHCYNTKAKHGQHTSFHPSSNPRRLLEGAVHERKINGEWRFQRQDGSGETKELYLSFLIGVPTQPSWKCFTMEPSLYHYTSTALSLSLSKKVSAPRNLPTQKGIMHGVLQPHIRHTPSQRARHTR